jgi:ATP-dependent DNA helicase RecQ
VLALTASATAFVQEDICTQLNFPAKKIIRQSFARPALSYSTFQVESKVLKLVEILQNVKGSSIVYCRSRKRTKEIAQQLISYNIPADYYHAGLDTETRSAKQDAWINDKVGCMVCTNAFGMGIDKSSVRAVVHFDLTDCLENYYQEAGRAGRDGKKSYAVLLFQPKDFSELRQQAEERFPTIEKIRELYQALMNFLQLPNGTGEGTYYDFNLHDFVVKFKFPVNFVINSLKVLQQENLISFSEQVFTPSKVEFVCNKDSLYVFEKSHAQYVPLIQSLLRTYEGIFDQPVFIFEKSLAYHEKMKTEEVTKQLHYLQSVGIIKYLPQKGNPQLYFLQNRVKAEDLRIDEKAYAERKKIFNKRLNDFIGYVESEKCRSRQIGLYFGDEELKDCGICDNCIKAKQKPLSTADFAILQEKILAAISIPIHPTALLQNLGGYAKQSTETVLDFLTAERIIGLNKDGLFERKN